MTVELVLGDITTQRVDAIVNAANSRLLGGGGVDGAIHRAAGPSLLQECRQLRATTLRDGLPVGQVVPTGAGELACRWVIHTVGPNRHRGQDNPIDLLHCFSRSLQLATDLGAGSIALPAVGAGVYGWDGDEVAHLAALAAAGPGTSWRLQIRFVLFSPRLLDAFERAFARVAATSVDQASAPDDG